mgnify:CR=1 FL=1|jgi:hypothetical protein
MSGRTSVLPGRRKEEEDKIWAIGITMPHVSVIWQIVRIELIGAFIDATLMTICFAMSPEYHNLRSLRLPTTVGSP